eukprot:gene8980-18583_t
MAYRVFIGNLPMDIRERDVDDLFYKYGRIRDIDLKTPSRPPAYAFITFDDVRDAEDAIRARDGYDYDGYRLRVEFAKGSRGDTMRSREPPRKSGGRRSEYRVIITGLPRSASWQDLKDHMRKAGDVIYADVDHNGDGVVEFSNREDMETAVRKLDDTEFKNPFDKTYIRVKYDRKGSRSRSRDSRSRSRSRDRDRDHRKRSYSKSHSRSRSRSPVSRSRSRSRSVDSRDKDDDKYKGKADDNIEVDKKDDKDHDIIEGDNNDDEDRVHKAAEPEEDRESEKEKGNGNGDGDANDD